LANYVSNPGGYALVGSILNPSPNGTAQFDPTNPLQLIFTPNTGFVGTVTLDYQVTDPFGNSAQGLLTLNVEAPSPVAGNITIQLSEDSQTVFALPATDSAGNLLTAMIANLPANGNLVVNSVLQATYTPDYGFVGTDTFTYQVSDVYGNSSFGIATLIVNDIAPIANGATFNVNENSASNLLRLSATTPISEPLFGSIVTQPTNGTATINTNTLVVTYTPNSGFYGTDSFVFQVADQYNGISLATETVDVMPTPPAASSQAISTAENTPVNFSLLATDVNPVVLTPVIVSQPVNGIVVLNSNLTGTYTPNANFTGTDSFTYEVSDGLGYFSNAAPVVINVVP